jgi:hypothetical protein
MSVLGWLARTAGCVDQIRPRRGDMESRKHRLWTDGLADDGELVFSIRPLATWSTLDRFWHAWDEAQWRPTPALWCSARFRGESHRGSRMTMPVQLR